MINEFKEGDRVYWPGNICNPPDSGAVAVGKNGSIYPELSESLIWVKWDSDGKIEHTFKDSLRLVEPAPTNSYTEEQAVMFLLSKGYRIEKVSTG